MSNKTVEKNSVKVKEKSHENNKPKNIIFRFFWYILYGLGLVSNHEHNDEGGYNYDHEEGGFETRVWILVCGLILMFIAFFNMFDSLFSDGDLLIPFFSEWRII